MKLWCGAECYGVILISVCGMDKVICSVQQFALSVLHSVQCNGSPVLFMCQ